MKLVSRSAATNIIAACLVVACLFVTVGDTYFCPDCSPRTLAASFGQSLPGSPAELMLGNDVTGSSEAHQPSMCPVCLSPLLSGTVHVPALLSFIYGSFQELPRLFSGVATTIYKPPRLAS